jgi:hypothetical protein
MTEIAVKSSASIALICGGFFFTGLQTCGVVDLDRTLLYLRP